MSTSQFRISVGEEYFEVEKGRAFVIHVLLWMYGVNKSVVISSNIGRFEVLARANNIPETKSRVPFPSQQHHRMLESSILKQPANRTRYGVHVNCSPQFPVHRVNFDSTYQMVHIIHDSGYRYHLPESGKQLGKIRYVTLIWTRPRKQPHRMISFLATNLRMKLEMRT